VFGSRIAASASFQRVEVGDELSWGRRMGWSLRPLPTARRDHCDRSRAAALSGSCVDPNSFRDFDLHPIDDAQTARLKGID